jgi:hypothetical protein
LLADAIVEEISASLSKSQQEKEELDDDVTKSQMTHKPKRPTHGPIRILSIPFKKILASSFFEMHYTCIYS